MRRGSSYGCTLLNWKFKLHYHLVKRLQRLFCEESVVASIFSYDCSLHRTISHYKTLSCSYSSGLWNEPSLSNICLVRQGPMDFFTVGLTLALACSWLASRKTRMKRKKVWEYKWRWIERAQVPEVAGTHWSHTGFTLNRGNHVLSEQRKRSFLTKNSEFK